MEVVKNPYLDWCDAHGKELATSYPCSFVAIDLDKGVVCHAGTNEEFSAKLEKMDHYYRSKLMITHTDLYREVPFPSQP